MESLYWKIQPILAPGLRNSKNEYADLLKQLIPAGGRWLDLGCGHHFLPDWMLPPDSNLPLSGCTRVGLDLDAAAIRAHPDLTFKAIATGQAIPFRDRSFHLVTSNMVMEHVERPEALFAEVSRVLRPGGRFLVHTPNVHGYTTLVTRCVPQRLHPVLARMLQDREEQDVYPTLFRANSRGELERLANACWLQIREIRFLHSTPVLVRVLPGMLVELLWIRLMYFRPFAKLRPCLLALFEKPGRP